MQKLGVVISELFYSITGASPLGEVIIGRSKVFPRIDEYFIEHAERERERERDYVNQIIFYATDCYCNPNQPN